MRKSLKKIKNPSLAKESRRKLAIRKKVIGASDVPRICITRTNKHLRVQAVDDAASKTLFSVQTYGKNKAADHANLEGAKLVGKAVSEQLKKHNLTRAVFDRSGKQYTGVIKTLADSIRENGIQI